MGILAGFLILSFYSVVAGWTLNYFFMCMVHFFKGRSAEEIRNSFDLLQKSPNIQIFWHFIFMLSTLGIVVGGVKKGIEKWSKLLMPALFLLLVALIVYSMIALPKGFSEAIRFTFTPSKLLPSSILEALGQAFFSLSLGMGAMLTYGSYLSKDSNIPKASVSVCFLDTLIALIACMVIFPIVFQFGGKAQEGPGLVFQSMPVLFAKIRGGLLVSMLFFILLGFAALTSAISLLEVVSSYFIDQLNWTRKKATIITATAIFIFGIPCTGAIFGNWKALYGKSFFDTVFELTFSWMLPLGGLLIAIYVGWFMNSKIRKKEFLQGTKLEAIYPYWLWLIRVVVPILIILVLFNKIGVLKTKDINKFFGVDVTKFEKNDLKKSFIVKLKKSQDPVSQFLNQSFSEKLQVLLKKYEEAKEPTDILKEEIVKVLNKLRKTNLYQQECFKNIKLQEETKKLFRKVFDKKSKGKDLLLLNRLILEDAYLNGIKKK